MTGWAATNTLREFADRTYKTKATVTAWGLDRKTHEKTTLSMPLDLSALALVEAALDTLQTAVAELDDAIKAAVNGEWDQEDYDRWYAAREAGEAALRAVREGAS